MSSLPIGNLRRFPLVRVLGFVVAAATVLVPGCKDSNDITGTTTTPATINVAGDWVGTFTPAYPAFYYAEPVPAHANLQQTGTSVEGTITISGSPMIAIHATISGNAVNGTIQDPSGAGTEVGTFSASQLKLALHPHRTSGAGELMLHR